MSLIQKLREKYVGVAVVAVIIALIGFLVMDSINSNVSNLFGGGGPKDLAVVNGQAITQQEFDQGMKNAEMNYKSQNPDAVMTPEITSELRENVINELIRSKLMDEEYNRIGLEVSKGELKYFMTSENASSQLKQIPAFISQQTGQFDGNMVIEYDKAMRSKNNPNVTQDDRDRWNSFMQSLINERKINKYNALVGGSLYAPTFLLDAMTDETRNYGSAAMVTIPYDSIDGSSIKVSDEDLQKVINAKKAMFKVISEERNADYVVFDFIPSSSDSSTVLANLNQKLAGLDTSKNAIAYINSNSNETVTDIYYPLSEIPNPAIASASVGQIVGPYFDEHYIKYTKILDSKMQPDSVEAAHILFDVSNGKYTQEAAQKKADSVMKVIKDGGMTFAAAAAAFSDDKVNAQKGGELGYFGRGMMVPQFEEVCFSEKPGEMKVVNTQFGTHIVKVENQKDFKPTYKLGNLSLFFEPSQETISKINQQVNAFASKAKDGKSFDEAVKSQKLTKREILNAIESSNNFQGLGESRDLNLFLFDSKENSVSAPISVGTSKKVIAKVTDIMPKGYKKPKDIRKEWEQVVINNKKAEIINGQIKGMTDMTALAAKYGSELKATDSVIFAGTYSPVLGMEPKAIGFVFDPNVKNNTVSPAIAGNSGVLIIKKNQVVKASGTVDQSQYPMLKQGYVQQYNSRVYQNILSTLYLNSDIKNNVNKFY